MTEIGDFKEALIAATKAGNFLKAVYECSLTENDERENLALAIAAIHNEGQVDVVAEFEILNKDVFGDSRFFITRRVFEQALPRIEAPVRAVMRTVLHLNRSAEQDPFRHGFVNHMMRIGHCLALLAILLSSPAIKAEDDVPAVCEEIFSMAASAIANKNKGLPESELRRVLPPREAASKAPNSDKAIVLEAMHDIVSEVYGGPTPERATYAAYRTEVCVRRMRGKPVPADFADVRPKLEACAKLSRDRKFSCAMQAAGSPEEDG